MSKTIFMQADTERIIHETEQMIILPIDGCFIKKGSGGEGFDDDWRIESIGYDVDEDTFTYWLV